MYKLLVLDVDGTMTDGNVYMSDHGEIFKAFNIKDGYGIKHIVPQMKMETVIITGRKSEIVDRRAKELDIEYVFQGVADKLACLNSFVDELNIRLEEVVYIGDDVNDLECIEQVGLKCCPADAHSVIKSKADYIAKKNGGQGAIREVIDLLFEEYKKNELSKC